MRADLLALNDDDLASLANRGLARRARQEAESSALACEFEETPAGDITARWSDGPECRLPAGARLTDARCTCPSATLCRHVLRTVIRYQLSQTSAPAPKGENTPVSANAEWSPAEITDAQLDAFFSPAELARWRHDFDAGHVIQVWTGVKPRAHLHTLGCTVNFLVPRDPRYAVCDCAATAPCGHALLSIWAARKMPAGQTAALVSTAPEISAAPDDAALSVLGQIEAELAAFAATGLARSSPLQADTWRRLSTLARDAALVWPADALHDIAELHTAYLARDARFAPRDFLALAAELLQRADAIRSGVSPVPPLFIRGTPRDRETEIASARLIGLGCAARTWKTGTEISAYLQDADTGTTLAITRAFAHEPGGTPKSFAALARTFALKGATLAAIGRGQLLVKGGRRSPSGRFIAGRAPVSVTPQACAWETLRAPLLVSSFAALREQLRAEPPAALGPRRVAARLAVCPVTGAGEVVFSVASQEIRARLADAEGGTAILAHPCVTRASAGNESLLAALRATPGNVRFVCAQARLEGAELVLAPLSVVFENASGRICIQPWVDDAPPQSGPDNRPAPAEKLPASLSTAATSADTLHDYIDELQEHLAETWLLGPSATAAESARLAALGRSLGLDALVPDANGFAKNTGALLALTVAADFAFREYATLENFRILPPPFTSH